MTQPVQRVGHHGSILRVSAKVLSVNTHGDTKSTGNLSRPGAERLDCGFGLEAQLEDITSQADVLVGLHTAQVRVVQLQRSDIGGGWLSWIVSSFAELMIKNHHSHVALKLDRFHMTLQRKIGSVMFPIGSLTTRVG